jgi:hypothetical protein
MEKIAEENKEKANELLNESFAKQADKTFNAEYMTNFMSRMLELIKPEFINEVKGIMSNHTV